MAINGYQVKLYFDQLRLVFCFLLFQLIIEHATKEYM